MYHPRSCDTDLQWIELYNQMAVDMDISHWAVTNIGETLSYTFPEGTVVPGGGYLVLAASPAALEEEQGFTDALGPFSGYFSPYGDRLLLHNNNAREMNEITFSTAGYWPTGPFGSGCTLAKKDRGTGSGPAENWTTSSQVGGTPGGVNFSEETSPQDLKEGLVSYWNFEDTDLGSGAYIEAFEKPDGALVDWTSHQGTAEIRSEALRLTASGTETFAWAGTGGSPIFFGNIQSISFQINFASIPSDTIGRHGGCVVCCSEPTERWSGSMSGYMIDWIDRTGDHGYRIIKMTNGEHTGIGSVSAPADPGSVWTIQFSENTFTVLIDGASIGTFSDKSYREGYLGFWCYQNAGQDIRFDNVQVEYTPVTTDFTGGNNGLLGTDVTTAEGLIGDGALAMQNSTGSFVNVGPGKGNNFSVTDGITIEAVMIPEWSGAENTTATIFSKHDASGPLAVAFQHDGDTATRDVPISPSMQPVLSFGLTTGGTYSELDMPLDGMDGRPALADVQDGSPHHIACVYHSSTGIKTIYVDGAACFTADLQPGSAIASGGGADALIGNIDDLSRPFSGRIDEVAFWERGLPAEEIAIHYNNMLQDYSYFALPPENTEDSPGLVFNEIRISNLSESWLELCNAGTETLQLEGAVLVNSRDPENEYLFPQTVLVPGAYLALDESGLGFDLAVDDTLFLYTKDRRSLYCAVYILKREMARYATGASRWAVPEEPTRGAENRFVFEERIVISEIMYHPMDDEDELGEFVEIYNRSEETVDLSGFYFSEGIEYTFPEGFVLSAGEYLVLSRNVEWMRSTYGIENVTGPYNMRLSNGGERIALVDRDGNPVDEVTYYDKGWWPYYADGGGSSLELRDPWADNTNPAAWTASDESSKSAWHTYSYRGRALSNRGPTKWNEFVLGLLDEGEILLDDLHVVESPDDSAVEFLQNGTFTGGDNTWRIIGTHRLSRVIDDPGSPGNKVLHLIATGETEHMHNHAETTFAGGERVVNGREYEISFRAKWLGGTNLLNTRLYFNRLPRTTKLQIPQQRGTPGRENSCGITTIGPTFEGMRHQPSVPEPGQETVVSVSAHDPDGITACTLKWRVNGGAWHGTAMTFQTGSRWHSTIPGQAGGAVVQFYIEGSDALGNGSVFPPDGEDSRALYQVNDGRALFEGLHNLRIIMLQEDSDFLHIPTNVMSNESLGGTVVYDEKEVYYDVGVRLRSSERGRLNDSRVGFNISFRPSHLFRGVHGSIGIDRAGGYGLGIPSSRDEILVKHMINHAGGIPGMYDDIVRVIPPRTVHTGHALLLMARFNDVYLGSQYANGEEGMLYTYELIYYPTTTVDGNPQSLKLPQPDQVIGVDIQNLGDDKEAYRWFYLIENNRARDDYSAHMNFCKNFAVSSSQLEEAAASVMDVDEWMRTFAMYSLCGIADTYGQGLQHNNMHYVRPIDNKVLIFPWDMDFSFYFGETALSLLPDSNIGRIAALPPYRRMFYRHLADIMDTTYNRAYMDRWIDHYGSICGQNYNRVKTYITNRAAYVSNYVSSTTSFSVDEVNNTDVEAGKVTVDATIGTVEGRASIPIASIQLNGTPIEVEWKSTTRWEVDIPLDSGPNTCRFTAFDQYQHLVALAIVEVTSSVNWHPPQVFMIDPATGPDSGGTYVALYGENLQEGLRVFFGDKEAESVTYTSPQIIGAVSPPGTGTVDITVENPDGIQGAAPNPFIYKSTEAAFQRGDPNADERINIADGVLILGYLFSGEQITCLDACDVNDDGNADISDAVALLAFLFSQGLPPPAPFQICGPDPTYDSIGCESFDICE